MTYMGEAALEGQFILKAYYFNLGQLQEDNSM